MKRIAVITFCIVLSSVVYAQNEKNNFFDHVTGSVGFKGAPVTSDKIHFTHIVDWSVGYKFKNKLSVGFNMESFYLFDTSKKSYNEYAYAGVGIKYLIFELEKNKNKTLSLEPHINIFLNSKFNALSSYDVGINFIMPKRSYCYFGTGVMQNFFDDGSKSIVSWYFSLGLRI